MAVIENLRDLEKFDELVFEMTGPELIAQHLVLCGAENALRAASYLIPSGAASHIVGEMLQNVRDSIVIVRSAATASSVQLVTVE
jgi:hypothetical protein